MTNQAVEDRDSAQPILVVLAICILGAIAGGWLANYQHKYEQWAAAEARETLEKAEFQAVFGFASENLTPKGAHEKLMRDTIEQLQQEYEAAERRLVPLRTSPALDPGVSAISELEFRASSLANRLAKARQLSEVPFAK